MTALLFSKKWRYGVALLSWMIVIFALSSIHGSGTNYEPSPWYVLERKGAHVAEFFILAFLASLFFAEYRRIREKRAYFFLIVFLFGVAYAFSDEIHQFFVFGRQSKFTDVLIDTVGVILGMIGFFFWKWKR